MNSVCIFVLNSIDTGIHEQLYVKPR